MTLAKIFPTRADLRVIFLVALIFLSGSPCAEANSELDAAEINLACAICSMGAYSDDESYLVRSMLASRGWQIEKLSRKNNLADTKAYLVSKGDIKILTIAGTENIKDFEVDFRFGRVHLHDNSAPLPADEKIPADKIFVHRGFRDYADVVLGDGLAERLKTSLEKNPHEILYLTGHSLGGSVATVMAIRLADMGVDKNRLKVITFGAMAVGSHGLAKNYQDKIDLTRVVMKGDVLKKSLRALGYVQFGKILEYRQSKTSKHFEHKMAVYLDSAIRDYYKAGGTFNHDSQNKSSAQIYVAPILLVEKSFHKSDKDLILNALNDSLANHFDKLSFAADKSVEIEAEDILENDFSEFVDAAKISGCKYILIRVLHAKRIRDTRAGDILVTLEEIILDENGVPLSMQTAGSSTENLTLIEASLAAQEILNERLKIFFGSVR